MAAVPDGAEGVWGWLYDSQPDARRVNGTERARPVSGLASGRCYDRLHRLPMPTPIDVARSG